MILKESRHAFEIAKGLRPPFARGGKSPGYICISEALFTGSSLQKAMDETCVKAVTRAHQVNRIYLHPRRPPFLGSFPQEGALRAKFHRHHRTYLRNFFNGHG